MPKDKAKSGPTPAPWPFPPIAAGAPGGEWEPPEGIKDVALLLPSLTEDHGSPRKKHKQLDLPVFAVPGLDGSYILSSDGSTRPYGEGH